MKRTLITVINSNVIVNDYIENAICVSFNVYLTDESVKSVQNKLYSNVSIFDVVVTRLDEMTAGVINSNF